MGRLEWRRGRGPSWRCKWDALGGRQPYPAEAGEQGPSYLGGVFLTSRKIHQPSGARRRAMVACGGVGMPPCWRGNKRKTRGIRQGFPGRQASPFLDWAEPRGYR